MNLPATASKPGMALNYTYDAVGRKLTKNANGSIRNYVDGIEYSGTAIDIIHTEEGVAQNNGGSFTYQYNLGDHLGNVRYTFDIYNGAVRRLQQDDYYAFGLRRSVSPVGLDNKYLYNGKEIQDELGGQYNYGARFYDPVIGSWNVVDPMSESYHAYSPYNYALNDPIGKLDPNGMWVETAGGYSTNNPDEISAFLGQNRSQQDKEEDPPKKTGRNAINKPGTIIRKNSVSQVPRGDGGTGLSDAMELGFGFTPIGTALDFANLIEGTDRSGNDLSWGWRLAGIIPLVSEFKNSNKVVKAATKVFGKEVAEVAPRIGRDGEAVEVIFKDGSKIDINAARVKEWVPNTHPKAPAGTLQKVKFENSLPGSKGYKREATQAEINYLKNLLK